MALEIAISAPVFAAWLYLIFRRGGYWRLAARLPEAASDGQSHPPVLAIIPARNEADVIAETVARHEAQDYPGAYRVLVVNDNSDDDTGRTARAAAGPRTTVIDAEPRPPGWTGKVWAMQQGLRQCDGMASPPAYILFTDADIHHPPDSLRRLVGFAEKDNRDLVSLMVRLKVATFWERLLIPAFVLFFAKLYPFARVNDPDSPVAAAAGGCMLVRRAAVIRAELAESIRGALIDDIALAQRLRATASRRIWLGLSDDLLSARAYGGIGGVWAMVARTAYTQLRFSPLLLTGSVLGMIGLYLSGPALTLTGSAAGAAIWALVALSFAPALRLYRQPLILAPLLPLAALLYTAMTLDSAWRHWRGKGGGWKGRYQAEGRA